MTQVSKYNLEINIHFCFPIRYKQTIKIVKTLKRAIIYQTPTCFQVYFNTFQVYPLC